MYRRALAIVCFVAPLCGCPGDAPATLDVVRVPETAYWTPDAAAAPDSGNLPDAGHPGRAYRIPSNCVVLREAASTDEGDVDQDTGCPNQRGSQALAPDQTQHVRDKSGKQACCYKNTPGDYAE